MIDERFIRTQLMFGKNAIENLCNARIAVFGVGGVGGYVVEILARAGVTNFAIFDSDKVNLTNINRQIIATTSSIGRYKIDVIKERILDINPIASVETYNCFYLPENADNFDLSKYDYVVDCIDTITAKVELAVRCQILGVKIISSLGSRNRLDYRRFKVCDIYETHDDTLAKVMRKYLRKRGVQKLKVVYSDEPSIVCNDCNKMIDGKYIESSPIGPSLMGIIIGGEVIKDIINNN